MARVSRGVTARARHKKVLKRAKGYYGRRKNVFRVAVQAVERGMQYAYRDRRKRKSDTGNRRRAETILCQLDRPILIFFSRAHVISV